MKNNVMISHSPILLVDDNVVNLKLLEQILEWAGFTNVTSCTKASRALQMLDILDPHLIILDLRMPEMDGFAFLDEVRKRPTATAFSPILVFTADLSSSAKVRALEAGASDFLTKPGDSNEIKFKIRNHLQARKQQGDLANMNRLLEAKVQERTEHLLVSRRETVELLARASEYRDDNTGRHARRVGILSADLSRSLHMDAEFVEHMGMAAPLHDIGKIAIPDSVLRRPGPLAESEVELMKTHVKAGAELLGENVSPVLQMAREIITYHHERWDGGGYLEGLAGEEIPLSARIVSVADAFDAMTNDRPYRVALSYEEALQRITANAGSQFDPLVAQALGRCLQKKMVA